MQKVVIFAINKCMQFVPQFFFKQCKFLKYVTYVVFSQGFAHLQTHTHTQIYIHT